MLDDVAVFSILWLLEGLFLFAIGQITMTENSRRNIVEAIDNGNPIHRINLPLYRDIPIVVPQVIGISTLFGSVMFIMLIIESDVRLTMDKSIALILFAVSLFLQVTIMLLIIRFKRRHSPNIKYSGFIRVLYSELIIQTPELAYYIFISIIVLLYILVIFRIVF